jgi:hypothetical protein
VVLCTTSSTAGTALRCFALIASEATKAPLAATTRVAVVTIAATAILSALEKISFKKLSRDFTCAYTTFPCYTSIIFTFLNRTVIFLLPL